MTIKWFNLISVTHSAAHTLTYYCVLYVLLWMPHRTHIFSQQHRFSTKKPWPKSPFSRGLLIHTPWEPSRPLFESLQPSTDHSHKYYRVVRGGQCFEVDNGRVLQKLRLDVQSLRTVSEVQLMFTRSTGIY